ncbi:MAG: heme exporter protein CcmD [Acidiferrobacterales bacterium]
MSWHTFFAMGGYAYYVWSAYGFATLVLFWNVASAVRKRRTVLKMLRELALAEQAPKETGTQRYVSE